MHCRGGLSRSERARGTAVCKGCHVPSWMWPGKLEKWPAKLLFFSESISAFGVIVLGNVAGWLPYILSAGGDLSHGSGSHLALALVNELHATLSFSFLVCNMNQILGWTQILSGGHPAGQRSTGGILPAEGGREPSTNLTSL